MKLSITGLLLCLLLALPALGQKRKSDREHDGLKGKVHTVRTERALLSDEVQKELRGKRMPQDEKTYDLAGNIVKYIGYDYKGNVDRVSTYSILDGDKVVLDTTIAHDYNPPPAAAPSGARQAKEDSRYSRKYKYQYDEAGNIKEFAVYRNNGALIARFVNIFDKKGNKIDQIFYRRDGSISQQIESRYDSAGNEIETTYLAGGGYEERKYANTYEHDAKGNWIKRNQSKVVIKDGKTVLEPYEVTYRTITYH